ncbi:hypothetical protein GALL_339380 [mine drainage metagenome]|uniref:Uncharacterized protein n=1 Tax=mine drainage metagenome TaxID=410659 RepID=A0A1J5QWM4_9ZZZZ
MKTKKTTSSKAIGYRRCVFNPKNGQTLQQLVSVALRNLSKAEHRMEPLDVQSTEIRVIGKHKVVDKMLCGFLSTFERGKSQAVITDDPQATSLSLGSIPPQPMKGGKNQEYIPGVLFFTIFDNHVALIQNPSLRGSSLESHLAWLLKSKTSTLLATTSIVLSDDAQKATKERIRKSHVKSIAFGQPLMTEFSPPKATISRHQATIQQPEKARFRPSGPIFELLKQYFDDQKFEKLGIDEIYDGNLEVWIELRYPKFQRSHAEDTVKLMDNLGIGLRDIEGENVSLLLSDGHKVSGSELKISGSIDVSFGANGLLDEDDVWNKMTSWLKSQLVNGVVDPD